MKRAWIVAAAVLSLMVVSLKAAEDPDKDKKVTAPNGNEMPLPLYQKLKAHFDGLYGSKAVVLPGVQPPDKAEIETQLKADAAANKAVLIKALGSSQAIQRELAARTLEYCGDKSAAVEALCKVVADDADESVRRAAATSLAKIPDAAAQDALIKALGDSVDAVRALSARALGNIKDSHSSEALLRILSTDAAPMVRMQAAMALKKIKDPNSLTLLKRALDSEKDENVKIAIAGAVRELIGDSTELADIPSTEQAGGVLTNLATDMKAVEDKLRNDRYDQSVVEAGTDIEKKLTTLIEKLEKSCGSCKSPGEDKKQQQASQSKGENQKKNSPTGKKDSDINGSSQPGAANEADVVGAKDSWAQLPPAQRDELMQAFSSDMPARWRKRLQAYFLSVNAEESKGTSR